MASISTIEIKNDMTKEVLEAMKSQVLLGMEACGMEAEGYAKADCPVDTGRLRNSVAHKVVQEEENTVLYVGSNVEYALYHEYGTGIYAENGMGRKTPWVYIDDKGVRHVTRGVKPRHMLKNSLANHKERYKAILEAALK